jgi:hypothetical protein
MPVVFPKTGQQGQGVGIPVGLEAPYHGGPNVGNAISQPFGRYRMVFSQFVC